MLEKCLETARQRRRTVGISQLIDDHRRPGRLLQQSLCDLGMRINPGYINRADARARNGCHSEPPVLAVGREQLHGVAHTGLKQVCQARANND